MITNPLTGAPPTLRLAPVAHPSGNPDAELIARCHRFAEYEFENWYRWIVLPEEEADKQDQPMDWDMYHWIVATPATTPEGWHAKALAYSAWDRDVYDDHPMDRNDNTTFLAGLLRDMVAPARNAIITRLAATYGPLSSYYTKEGIWIGPTAEEKEVIAARWAAEHPPVAAKPYTPTPLEDYSKEDLRRVAAFCDHCISVAQTEKAKILARLAEVAAGN